MRKVLFYGGLIFAADWLLPAVETGAQIAIAPLILAAIPAVAGLIGQSMQKAPPPALQRGGGISMQPMIGPGGTDPTQTMQVEKNPLVESLPANFGNAAGAHPSLTTQGTPVPEATAANTSKMQEAVKKADKGKVGMDEKLQMAALAAQLGAGLFGAGNAPPPPGAPRGGGMQFASYSPRDLYGG